ncbi:MAG: DUF4249 domain-containing protein [Salinivirgaceae bacterium]|nr:DUF4249 domain-containing protein [Salinivirgaceae bacterium]
MNHTIKMLSSIVFGLIMSSCTKTVEFDIPNQKEKPVILAYAESGKHVQVLVTKTYPITQYVLPNTIEMIQTNVRLTLNDNQSEELTYSNGVYQSLLIPEDGDVLKLRTTVYGDSIFASSTMPIKCPIKKLNYKADGFIDSEGDKLNQISFEFDDDSSKTNYYEIYVKRTISNENGIETIKPYYYASNDPVLLNEGLLDYEIRSLLFSDILFNGKSVVLSVAFSNIYLYNEEKLIKSEFFLASVSETYYNYQKTLYKHMNNQSSGSFWQSLSEPVPIYTGITNAYGVFAAYSISSQEFNENE